MMEHWKDCKCLTLDYMTGNCRKIQAMFYHAILRLGFCFILQVFYPVIELFCIELILQLKYPALMYIMEFDYHAKEMTGNPQQCIGTILGFAKPAFKCLGKSVLQLTVLESSVNRIFYLNKCHTFANGLILRYFVDETLARASA